MPCEHGREQKPAGKNPRRGGVPPLAKPFPACQAPHTRGSQRRECHKHVGEHTAGHAGLGFHIFLTLNLSCRFSGLQGAGLDTLTPPHRSACEAAWLGHSVIRSDRQMIHIVVSRVFSCPKQSCQKRSGRLSLLTHPAVTQRAESPK